MRVCRNRPRRVRVSGRSSRGQVERVDADPGLAEADDGAADVVGEGVYSSSGSMTATWTPW